MCSSSTLQENLILITIKNITHSQTFIDIKNPQNLTQSFVIKKLRTLTQTQGKRYPNPQRTSITRYSTKITQVRKVKIKRKISQNQPSLRTLHCIKTFFRISKKTSLAPIHLIPLNSYPISIKIYPQTRNTIWLKIQKAHFCHNSRVRTLNSHPTSNEQSNT